METLDTHAGPTAVDDAAANDATSLDPADWEELRRVAHRAVDRMIELQRGLADAPAWRPVPDEVDAELRAPAPLEPQGLEGAYADFERLVLPYPAGNLHPRFWGWVPGQGTGGGLVAGIAVAGMNCAAGQFNDASSRVHDQVIDWMRVALGFPDGATGVLTSGGSVANLVGIAAGRDARAPEAAERGLAGAARCALYASVEVHSSVDKAAQLLGLGRAALRRIEVDAQYRMRHDQLIEQIRLDREEGILPLVVIGNVGAVDSGAIDDLDGLADISREHGLWLHLDGAYGAIAALSAKLRPLLRGMERADSLAFDLHKWTSVPYDIGCVLVRDRHALRHSFSVPASYLAALPRGTSAREDPTGGRGLQLSRGFRGLKAWLSIKEHGLRRFGDVVDKNVEQMRRFAAAVTDDADLELLSEGPLVVVCYRYKPAGMADERCDDVNREILMRVQEAGIAVPSGTVRRGHFALRVANTNHRTRQRDLDLLRAETVRIGADVRREWGC